MEKDERESARLLEAAADMGEPDAQLYLGRMYEHGIGVERSPSRSRAWYGRAALQGDDYGMEALTRFYERVCEDKRRSGPNSDADSP